MAANAKSTSSKDSSSKGSSPKGSLSSLIARARAAQEIDEATPKAVPAPTPTPEPVEEKPTPPAVAEAPPTKPQTPSKSPKAKRAKEESSGSGVGRKKKVAKIPELAPDRRQGRRGNPEYRQANAYIPKTLHMRVKRALLDEGDREFSSLVEELLESWLEAKGV